MLASIFVAGGIDQVLNPEKTTAVAESVVTPLVGKSVDTTLVVQADGAVKVAAGVALGLGRFPRIAALALAGSLIPTTAAAHRFWEFEDPEQRQLQQVQFVKNVSLLGGLLLASVDTAGKPSVGWRARRAASKLSDQLAGTPSTTAAIGETAGNVAASIEAAAVRAKDAFPADAIEQRAGAAALTLGDAAVRAKEAFPGDAVEHTAHSLVARAEDVSSRADRRKLMKATRKAAKDARKQWHESIESLGDAAGRARESFPKDPVGDVVSAASDKVDSVVSRRDRRKAKKDAKKAAKQLRKDVAAAAETARETVEHAVDVVRSSAEESADKVRAKISA